MFLQLHERITFIIKTRNEEYQRINKLRKTYTEHAVADDEITTLRNLTAVNKRRSTQMIIQIKRTTAPITKQRYIIPL